MQHLKLATLHGLTLGTLLAVTLASSAVTFFHSHEAAHREERIALAQQSYAEHLALQSNVNALFKQHGDALLFGDRHDGALGAEIGRSLATNIARIRAIIAAEVLLVGDEEVEELEHLARIEAKVRSLTETLRVLSTDGAMLPPEVRRQQMIDLMDREIDVRLSAHIAEALAEENEEVQEARAAAAAFGKTVQNAVFVIGALSGLITATALYLFHRGIARPARDLMLAVSRLEQGDYSAAPQVGGVRELRQIGVILGRMAALLRLRQANQKEQTRALEAAVAERTSEVSQMLAKVEAGERSRRQMMADVSHELRTPLTVILGEADVALRIGKDLPEEFREALGRVRETARHANAIVDDLLFIARKEAGKLRLDLSEVDLCQLVTRTSALVQHPVGLMLPDGLLRLRIDPIRIRQCLLALLQNAIRYGGDEITVSVELAGGSVRIAVEDNGPGMSETEKAEAFERFFRGPNAVASGVEGTGLGLPIVRAIAQAHGGEAGLGDRPDGGLRVWITLPADRAPVLVALGAA